MCVNLRVRMSVRVRVRARACVRTCYPFTRQQVAAVNSNINGKMSIKWFNTFDATGGKRTCYKISHH